MPPRHLNIKNLLLGFLLALPFFAIGQNPFSFGINGTAKVSLMKAVSSPDRGFGSDIYEEGEKRFGYSFGGQVQYEFEFPFLIRSGIHFEKSSYYYSYKGLVFSTDIINGTESSFENHIDFSRINIPVHFGYRFSTPKEKMGFVVGIGASYNFLLNAESKQRLITGGAPMDIVVEEELMISNISTVLFFGIELKAGEIFLLGIEPELRFIPSDFSLDLFTFDSIYFFEPGLTLRFRAK